MNWIINWCNLRQNFFLFSWVQKVSKTIENLEILLSHEWNTFLWRYMYQFKSTLTKILTFWQHLPAILPQYCSNILAICCSNIAVISFFVCKLDLRQYCQNVLRQYCCKAFLGAGCSSTAAMHIAAILLQSSSNNCAVAILLQHYSIQVHIVTK